MKEGQKVGKYLEKSDSVLKRLRLLSCPSFPPAHSRTTMHIESHGTGVRSDLAMI